MILIDGQRTELVAADDRGLHYGDGVFETIATVKGRPQLWSRHMARLVEGCRRLAIPPPDENLLRAEAEQLMAIPQERAVLKIIVTRGSGGRGYRPPAACQPRRLLYLSPWPEYPASWARHGVEVHLCGTRLACNPALAGIKHLNRLEQVLARAEWDDPAIAEGLMLDTDGHVIEGTMSNLWLVQEGCLLTPSLERCGVAGVMRAHLLAQARELGLACSEAVLELSDLEQAEEVFLSNSLIGIWPVRRAGPWHYAPGEITRRMVQALAVGEEA